MQRKNDYNPYNQQEVKNNLNKAIILTPLLKR